MRKEFLLKTAFLVILLAVVLAVIIGIRSGRSGFGSAPNQQVPTFFEQFVIAGGPIVWFVLLPTSIITVFLATQYSLTIRRKILLPEGIGKRIAEMIQQFDLGELKAKLAGRSDFVSIAVAQAVSKGKGDWLSMRSLLGESLQDQAWSLLRKIEWISLIGNVSPMVGLFGTVFGMIKLFNAIVISGGQPRPAHLAGGISVALVTTFWGLFIAIPALALHGVFRNRIETLVSDAVVEADDIIPQIRNVLKTRPQQTPTVPKQSVVELHIKSKPQTSKAVRPLRQ